MGYPADPVAAVRPKARVAGLVVREVGGEVVLYDHERHRAHCLRETVAAVWRRCDGGTSVGEIARAVTADRKKPVADRAVLAAARRLERAHLLDGRLPRRLGARGRPEPGSASAGRRALLRGAVVTGGLAVLSLAVPTPEAAAATCLGSGACVQRGSCTNAQGLRCCSGSCRQGGTACGTGQGFTSVCN